MAANHGRQAKRRVCRDGGVNAEGNGGIFLVGLWADDICDEARQTPKRYRRGTSVTQLRSYQPNLSLVLDRWRFRNQR